jgi:peptidoglycan glycosyltransferase
LTQYAKQFGILESMTFDGIKTAAGHLEADKPGVSLAWSAIGQHKDLVNPASFLAFVSAVANGGMRQVPHLVNQISVDGRITYESDLDGQQRIMSGSTAETLRELMRNNVENYYGDENFEGFTVCAKSGTAEVGGNKKPNAMFTGFVVDEGYPLAFMVTIEDGGYGRLVCVPVLQKVLAACREVVQ